MDGRGGREEFWGIEGRKTVISINYRRKKMFSVKGKEKNPLSVDREFGSNE